MTAAPKKPKTFNGNLEQLPAALHPLTEHKHWLNWNWEWRAPKWTKPPIRPCDLRYASSNDPATWDTYEHALRRFRDGDADGIGFALLDAEHCRRRSGRLRPPQWRRQMGDRFLGESVAQQRQRCLCRGDSFGHRVALDR